jgi:predicted chitinase
MRANEFILNEAEGTFYHGTRSDFDFNQMSGGKGMINFDRVLGPHFSRTPEIASRFAMFDPQSTQRQRKPMQGGRVFPVHIPGEVYVLPQPRGMLDMAAVALDAFNKVILPNKELLDKYIELFIQTQINRIRNMDKMREKLGMMPDTEPTPDSVIAKRLQTSIEHYLKHKNYQYISNSLFQLEFADPEFLKHIAEEYKHLLMSQGYGLIQYKNTNPKETRGIQDKSSYIALAKPKSVFDKEGQVNEGWGKFAAAAGLGAVLGGPLGYHALKGQEIPQPTTTVQQQQLPVKQLKPLEKILVDTATQAGIKGTELKQFLAQCAHETLNYSTLEELGGNKYIARKYDRKYNPVKAKSLGNKQIGDGLKYKGRGFIQLTGRYNYKEAGKALNLPLEQHPELVERPDIAAKTSVWFWKHRVQPNVADYSDVKQSTKPINPKLKGLPSRQSHYDKYAQVDIPVK